MCINLSVKTPGYFRTIPLGQIVIGLSLWALWDGLSPLPAFFQSREGRLKIARQFIAGIVTCNMTVLQARLIFQK